MINTINIFSDSVTIVTILKYYGLLCLILLPVSLPTMIIVSRKTNLMDRIDRFVDRLWEGEKKKNPATEVQAAKKDIPDKKTEAEEQKPESENLPFAGVTTFEMPVGKTYRCYLNYQNRGGGLGAMVWFMENEFIGTISPDGLFKANKVGTANIFCSPKDSAYESGAQAYSIRIAASNENWFAANAATWVEKHTDKADILSKLFGRKITNEIPESGIICYEGNESENSKELILQFDKQNKLTRCLFVLHNNALEILNRLAIDLNERMEEVTLLKTDGTRIWIHEIIDEQHEEVDFYAFMKNCDDEGKLFFGIGQSWRDFGEKEEFLENISMSLRMFMKTAGWKEIPELEAEIEKKEETTEEKTADAAESANKPSEPEKKESEKKPEQKREPEPEPQPEPEETEQSDENEENEDVDFKEDIDSFENFNEEEDYNE